MDKLRGERHRDECERLGDTLTHDDANKLRESIAAKRSETTWEDSERDSATGFETTRGQAQTSFDTNWQEARRDSARDSGTGSRREAHRQIGDELERLRARERRGPDCETGEETGSVTNQAESRRRLRDRLGHDCETGEGRVSESGLEMIQRRIGERETLARLRDRRGERLGHESGTDSQTTCREAQRERERRSEKNRGESQRRLGDRIGDDSERERVSESE